jgi:hypothetical protein
MRFEDVAPNAGINFILRDGAAGQRRLIETMTGGVAVLDYNNDGRPDIYFVNGAEQPSLRKTGPDYHNRLYRNDGALKFTDVTNAAGVAGTAFDIGAAAADYDNDGDTDLFIAGVNRNTLYRNRGDGRFEDATAQAGLAHQQSRPWAVGGGWFDYDNDGDLDLFVVNYVAWDPARERTCMIGKARTYCHPRHFEGLPNALYRNNGDGSFTDVSQASGIAAHKGKGMAAAFLDYDADGKLDVFVTNDTVPNFLFRNEGGGRFRETALIAGVAFNDDGRAVSSMGADARDFDGDGREDLFVTANNNETFPLFRNLGQSIFADVTYSSGVGKHAVAFTGWSNGIFDFDNDGRKDLFAACGAIDGNVEEYSERQSKHRNLLLNNAGNGRFTEAGAAAGPSLQIAARHRGAAFSDFDGDGRIDIVVTRIGEPALLLRNITASRHHWLGLRLRGRRSNRDGLGAMVRLTEAGGAQQWNRATTAVGYASSSDSTIWFGLGAGRAARTVEIRWPSGIQQTLENVAADRVLTVEEADESKASK